MGLSNSDWNYVSSLFPDNANVFFKWGGELGTAPNLTYSFVNSGPLQFDAAYTQDLDAAYGSGYAASFSTYSGSDPSRHMIEFSGDEKTHQGNARLVH